MTAFDPSQIIAVLAMHGVDFVVVGGYAAAVHGATRPTYDLDACPATDRNNLDRLAGALRELQAKIRVDDVLEGFPFDTSADALVGMTALNLRTRFGDLDLTFAPTGTGGFLDLVEHASVHRVGDIEVRIASLADVIRSKEAAGRAKDLDALPELHRIARHKAGQ
jgi:hypothetical protein